MKSIYNFSGILLFALLLFSSPSRAEPYLAVKTGLKCGMCHVNPIGGGMRNNFGNIYGHSQMSVETSDFTSSDMGKITEFLGIGGNLRYNGEYIEDDADNSSQGFRIDSGQLYIAVTPKGSGLTLYLDQQVAPGSALNREAFALYRFDNGHYIKAGKMYVPVGLRLEDDSAFIRQATGFNFDSSDNGVEVGLEYGQTTINLFVTNGTGSVSNNDDKFLFGGRLEHLFSGFRVGSTLLYNDSDSSPVTLFNVYGGAQWKSFTFLAELDWMKTEQMEAEDTELLAGLFEINYEWMKGLNIKFTSEFLDPIRDLGNDHETRYSLLAEYTPISNVQLRGGVRIADSIPQRPERSTETVFLQAHVYF
jgi:hypothetical protein